VGLSSEEIEDSRRSIADQKYWKYEVEHWGRIIKMREFEMREALLGQNEEQHQSSTQEEQAQQSESMGASTAPQFQ